MSSSVFEDVRGIVRGTVEKRKRKSAIYGMQAPVHPPCCDSIPVLVSRTTRPRLDSITTSVNSTLRFRNN